MSDDGSMKRHGLITAACAIAAAAATWENRSPMPEGVAGGSGAFLQGRLVYAGGTTWRDGKKIWLSRAISYDPRANAWAEAPALPEPLGYGAFVSHKNSLEILGGLNDSGVSRKIWRLGGLTAQWEQIGVVPIATALGRAASVGNRLYLFGGCSDAADLQTCSDHVYVRDSSGEWKSVSALPGGAVALSASAAVGHSIYLFGGCVSTGQGSLTNLAESWRFDSAHATWHKLRPLPVATRGISAVALSDNSILLAGGYHASQEQGKLHGPEFGFSNAVWRYRPETDQYTAVPALPLGLSGPELLRWNDTVFALGGEDRARSRSADLLAFTLR